MKYAILTAAMMAISTTPTEAKIESCGDAFRKLSQICSQDKSHFSADYWKCKTGAAIAFGICKVMERQVTAEVTAELNKACSDRHSKACEDKLDEVVANAAKAFASEPGFSQSALLDEIKKETVGSSTKK